MSEFTLPEGWVFTFVGNVFTATQGVQISKSNQIFSAEYGYRKYLYISDFKHNNSPKFVKDEFPEKIVTNDDLIMANTGTPGAIFHGIDGILSNNLFKIGFERSFIEKSFAYHFFTSPIFRVHLDENHKQTAQPHIGHKVFSETPFVLPPLAEQQQIAQKLDELLAQVDTLKTRLDAIPKILKRFRQSVLAAAVSGRLTEGVVNLRFVDDVCAKAFDGPFGSKLKTSDYTNAGVRVARLENVGHLHFDNEKQTFISTEKAAELEGNRLKQGDVLFSSFVDEEVRVCVFKQKEAFINKADCFCLRPDNRKVSSEFLAYTLSSVTSYFQIKEQVQGVTRPRINLRILKSLSFNFPSIEEQTEIVRRVEQLFAYADQIEQRVKDAQARVNHLTQSILAKAFRGELTADWRTQNPELISGENSAAALLERIKAERDKVSVKRKRVK